MFHRLRLFLIGALATLGMAASAQVQDINFFTIGSGGVGFTYFQVGGMIANAISKPPGSRDCEVGGSCGVNNLVAMAVSSNGSADNLIAISYGERDSGLAQSDVAHWAYTGTGIMQGQPPATKLRTIAALFEEHVHIVTLAKSGINTISDLKGKRVSLDNMGSGTYIDAQMILKAAGLSTDDISVVPVGGQVGLEALRKEEIDALFIIAGYPVAGLSHLTHDTDIKLLPIPDETAKTLINESGFFTQSDIPDGVYSGVGAVPTISVMAQWYTSADRDEEMIYQITKALWHESNKNLFHNEKSQREMLSLKTALEGISVPLHPGAERYYKEVGIIN